MPYRNSGARILSSDCSGRCSAPPLRMICSPTSGQSPPMHRDLDLAALPSGSPRHGQYLMESVEPTRFSATWRYATSKLRSLSILQARRVSGCTRVAIDAVRFTHRILRTSSSPWHGHYLMESGKPTSVSAASRYATSNLRSLSAIQPRCASGSPMSRSMGFVSLTACYVLVIVPCQVRPMR